MPETCKAFVSDRLPCLRSDLKSHSRWLKLKIHVRYQPPLANHNCFLISTFCSEGSIFILSGMLQIRCELCRRWRHCQPSLQRIQKRHSRCNGALPFHLGHRRPGIHWTGHFSPVLSAAQRLTGKAGNIFSDGPVLTKCGGLTPFVLLMGDMTSHGCLGKFHSLIAR